jgi:ABC-type sulfate transport system permease subunit
MTVLVEGRYQQFDTTGAYTASVTLAVLAILTLMAMILLQKRRGA